MVFELADEALGAAKGFVSLLEDAFLLDYGCSCAWRIWITTCPENKSRSGP